MKPCGQHKYDKSKKLGGGGENLTSLRSLETHGF